MDFEQIKNLAELMVANDLSRIELREGETHVLLRRGQPIVTTQAPAVALPAAVPGATPDAAAASAEAAGEPATDEIYIRSPMVGTFYTAPDPESPAFIKVGDNVGPESVVCLVEAMKVFNEIKAEVSGRITQVLAKNAEAIEYDQPLFAVASA